MAREDGFFDDLARGLADGTLTRGKALRLMGAAIVGGTLGSFGIGAEASADPPGCKRDGKHCTRNKQCCSGNCDSISRTCADAGDCPAGRVELSNGTCAKPCSINADCAGCGGDEECVQGPISGEEFFCAVSLGSRAPCMDDSQCTPGELCNNSQCVASC
jgi:hypothetical protein